MALYTFSNKGGTDVPASQLDANFTTLLNQIAANTSGLSDHVGNLDNPHEVTAAQIGALAASPALLALTELTPAANALPYFTGPTTADVTTLSAFSRGLLALTDAATWQTGIGAEGAITAGTTAQYWRGDKSWQTLNTTAVTEGTNLYYTDVRADARVQNAKGTATPLVNGTASAGNGTTWAPINHIHPTDTSRAPLASPAFTGIPTVPTAAGGTNTTQAASTAYVQGELASYLTTASAASTYATIANLALKAPLASPALTGTPTAPTASAATNTTQIATTAYVQTNLAAFLTTASAASTYAPLASPALTGTPTAPTASGATNTTQIATTAFVQTNLALKAPLASPALTGVPTAPTAAANNNSTQIATTAYVDTGLTLKANVAGGTFTGGITVPSSKVDGAAGTNRRWDFTTSNVRRWLFGANSTAESGSNAGSDMVCYAVADDGTTNTLVYTITRSTGVMGYSISPTAPTPTAGDNTTKLATTAFVQTATGGQVWGNIHYVNGGVPSDIGLTNIYIDTAGSNAPQAYTQNYTSSSSMTGGAAVQGIQIYGVGTMAPATPNAGMAESNFLRTNHTIGSTAGKQFHWHTINSLVSTSNDASGSDGPDGVTEGAIFISTWRATGPTASGAPIGGWCLDMHNEKYASVRDGKMVIGEFGMHKVPTLGSARNRGLDVWSGDRSGATSATRAGEAIRVGGGAGWTYLVRLQHTDDTTDIFRIDQNGNIVQTVPAGNYSNLVQTAANNTNLVYQQVAKDAGGTQFSGVMQTTASAVLFGSASGSAIGTYLQTNGTTRAFVDASGHFRPTSDNAYTLGSSGNRWSVVYAATGTINTSDARQKEVVGSLDFSEKFVSSINPVLFKWKEGGTETVQVGTKKVKTGNKIEKRVAVKQKGKRWVVTDGVAREEEYTDTLMTTVYGDPVPCVDAEGKEVWESVPAHDDNGDPIVEEYTDEAGQAQTRPATVLQQKFVANPVMVDETREEPVFETKSKPGSRVHAGFLAQDVKAQLDALGIDFGVWGLEDTNDPNSGQWIRPDQMLPPLWVVVQKLLARVEALEAK